jgi:hypothetical protein
MVVVCALGLTAAFLFAFSAVLQQRAARRVAGDDAALRGSKGVTRLAGGLVRSRTWMAGWLTNLAGVGTQAAALNAGSVTSVQPLMSAQLLFVLVMASLEQRRWPSLRDWLSAAAVCAGLAVLLVVTHRSLDPAAPHRHRVALAAVCVAGLILVVRQVSRLCPTVVASLLIGVAAGLCQAMTAMFLQLTVMSLTARGPLATVLDWPVYAMLTSAVGGLLLGQIAFATGPLPPAVAAMSVTNPVASFTVGVLADSAPFTVSPAALAVFAACGLAVALGIVGLANASSTRTLYVGSRVSDTPEPDVDGRAVLRLR